MTFSPQCPECGGEWLNDGGGGGHTWVICRECCRQQVGKVVDGVRVE